MLQVFQEAKDHTVSCAPCRVFLCTLSEASEGIHEVHPYLYEELPRHKDGGLGVWCRATILKL